MEKPTTESLSERILHRLKRGEDYRHVVGRHMAAYEYDVQRLSGDGSMILAEDLVFQMGVEEPVSSDANRLSEHELPAWLATLNSHDLARLERWANGQPMESESTPDTDR